MYQYTHNSGLENELETSMRATDMHSDKGTRSYFYSFKGGKTRFGRGLRSQSLPLLQRKLITPDCFDPRPSVDFDTILVLQCCLTSFNDHPCTATGLGQYLSSTWSVAVMLLASGVFSAIQPSQGLRCKRDDLDRGLREISPVRSFHMTH